MWVQLIPLDGGEPIQLAKSVTLVGRQADCDLCLERANVSKAHCLLVQTDGFLFVRDLASTNGTKVNGQRIRRAALLPGDQLSLAGHKFRVWLAPDGEPAGAESPTQAIAQVPASEQPGVSRPRGNGSGPVPAGT